MSRRGRGAAFCLVATASAFFGLVPAASAKSKLSVTWPSALVAGRDVTVSGKAPSGQGVKVLIERKKGKRWTTAGSAKDDEIWFTEEYNVPPKLEHLRVFRRLMGIRA